MQGQVSLVNEFAYQMIFDHFPFNAENKLIVCNIGVDANGLDGLGAVQGEIEIENIFWRYPG